jgi:hypothetical protein
MLAEIRAARFVSTKQSPEIKPRKKPRQSVPKKPRPTPINPLDAIDLSMFAVVTNSGTLLRLQTLHNLETSIDAAIQSARTGIAVEEPKVIMTWNSIATIVGVEGSREDWTAKDKKKMLSFAEEHLEKFCVAPSSRQAVIHEDPAFAAEAEKALPGLFKMVSNEVDIGMLSGIYFATANKGKRSKEDVREELSAHFRLRKDDYSMGGGPNPVIRVLRINGKATGLDAFPERAKRGPNKSHDES